VVHQEETIVGHGGWADYVRAQARFTVPIPDNLDSAIAGPLMCAGTTVWTPMTHYGTSRHENSCAWCRRLGHLAVQFLAKFGTDVTALSVSARKEARGLVQLISLPLAAQTNSLKQQIGLTLLSQLCRQMWSGISILLHCP